MTGDSQPVISTFDVGAARFHELVVEASHTVPVLVDFWAEWCGPCRNLAPVLAELVAELDGRVRLAKVDTEAEPTLAAEHGIRSLPTVRLYRDGAVVEEFLGAQSRGYIAALLERHLPRDSDATLEQAARLAASGEPTAARDLLAHGVAADPTNARLYPALGALLLADGLLEDTEALLRAAPRDEIIAADLGRLGARLGLARRAAGSDLPGVTARLATDPTDSEARLIASAHYALAGDFDAAMSDLLEVLRRDRGYADGAARGAALALFDLLGADDPRVRDYRRALATALN